MLIVFSSHRRAVTDSAHQTNLNDAFNHMSEPEIKEYFAKSQRAKCVPPFRTISFAVMLTI